MDYRGHASATLDLGSKINAESNERSVGDVLKDIGNGIGEIVRWEIKLAKIEMADNVRQLQSSSIMLAIGGLLGIFAVGFILLAAMFALEMVLSAWLAALIIGVLLCAGAGIGLSAGSQRLKAMRAPQKTMQTVREDLQWMKEQAKS